MTPGRRKGFRRAANRAARYWKVSSIRPDPSMDQILFRQVVSLGPSCRGKHQMKRVLGPIAGPRGVFDWQTTPVSALIAYLDRDFAGFFEREDLVFNQAGAVYNRRYLTGHPHEFAHNLTPSQLDAAYPAARRAHDKWCEVTRRAILRPQPALFLFDAAVTPEQVATVEELLRRWNPSRPFRILQAPASDDDKSWEGNDAAWDRHLANLNLVPSLSARLGLWLHQGRKRLGLRSA